MMTGQGPGGGALNEMLQQYDPEQFQDLFKQSYIDPAMMMFEQDMMPKIQQRFVNANAGSSSALNQALAAGARDVSTVMGSQAANFYNQQQSNKLQALQVGNQAAGVNTFMPQFQQHQGQLGNIMQMLMMFAGGGM